MAIYYVDENKSGARDSNAGTAASPWLTIQHAADHAEAGDTIYVKSGTYKPFEIVSSGTATKPIVFAAFPGDEHDVIIDGTGTNVRGLIQARGESHIAIKGFHLRDAPTDGIFVEGSKAGSRNIVISNNQVENTDNSGIYAAGLVMGQTIGVNEYRLFDVVIENNDVSKTNITGNNEAITVGGGLDGFTIRGNWVHDSQQFGIDVKLGAKDGIISNNVVENIEKHGIYLDSGSRTIENVKIFNNTVSDNANGIVLAREANRSPKAPNIDNIDIYDNLVYDNERSGIVAYEHIWDTGTGKFNDVVINSNTVYDNGMYGIQVAGIESFASNFAITNNTVFGHKKGIDNQIGARESGNTVSSGDLKINAADGADANPGGESALAPQPQPEPDTDPSGFEAHYNLGGGALTTTDDIVFKAAPKLASGSMVTRDRGAAIAATQDDGLYQTYGFGNKFAYAIAVPEDGVYRVELHLAELWHQKTGQRVFDVSLEGSVPLAFNDIDIFARAGGVNKATTVSAQVKVTDGTLNLEALQMVDLAQLNAFSIYYDSPL